MISPPQLRVATDLAVGLLRNKRTVDQQYGEPPSGTIVTIEQRCVVSLDKESLDRAIIIQLK